MARVITVTCDKCGASAQGPTWPDNWYHWHRQDLCRTCALPEILAALRGCDEADAPDWASPNLGVAPAPLWTLPQAPGTVERMLREDEH
ncbi:hypothetical protein [Candidatus Solirubrobacter pratensis]|uniref:hypothetical protein n=1 Tax=Candidatus Solirubrobacter pratensis TaxID=1298857 RepID=UPI00040CA98A|nr:hypothetical protein [Candidatus Solirubrobacter pratensis]